MQRMRHFVMTTGLALALTTLLARPASADLLRPAAGRAYPDIAADINGIVKYTYDPGIQAGLFHLRNTPYLLAGGPTSADEFQVAPGSNGFRRQTVNVALDRNGKILSNDPNNSYELWGKVVANGVTYDNLLLKGLPTAFGAQNLNANGLHASAFDLDVKITGGSLASAFGPDLYLSLRPELNNTFNGSFTQDFSADKATSNTRAYHSPHPFPVPEPTAVLVILAGGVTLASRHRRRLAKAD